ncbi:endonuclease domain-containing protein [Aestuariivivens sediminis]|uniref:endonuclease domain-containing protein n=1 Tax=Aestuariivivens sediminis TaxID=2913557 RepID=UPI001F55C52E|nr:endonuclease domain-containing protein [Aestuariivivens sediminis]
MRYQRLHSKKELEHFRKELRENLTPAEAYLWKQLKARKFYGRRFTKQHSIGPFIVDFYCASEKLIIELDGEVHNHQQAQEYDANRTLYLESLGYRVLRFENKMVFENLASVLKEICSNFLSKPSV